jgi:hypothetical protein
VKAGGLSACRDRRGNTISSSSKENAVFKYEEINMNFEVTLYCAE